MRRRHTCKRLLLTGATLAAVTAVCLPTPLSATAAASGLPSLVTSWAAGYLLKGGPFRTVNGSFTVTSANDGWSTQTQLNEVIWMGHLTKTGFTDFAAVGVVLQLQPCDGGNVTPDHFYTCGFSYTYPGTDQGGAMPLLQVEAGDSMSATIEKQPGTGNYKLELSDDTVAAQCLQDCSLGAAYDSAVIHDTSLQSTEIGWFVSESGSSFTGFSPPVRFSAETYIGSAKALTKVSLHHRGYSVTPSAVKHSGAFSLSFE